MGEDNQAKWIGIRPVNPAEDIPVKESSPLSSLEVEPKAGTADFPVTLDGEQPTVKTQKKTPAIADLQAISGFKRESVSNVQADAGDYDAISYTIPAGKIFFWEYTWGLQQQNDPTGIQSIVESGGDDYYMADTGTGAGWATVNQYPKVYVDEGEKAIVRFMNCVSGNDLWARIMGYLIDKY